MKVCLYGFKRRRMLVAGSLFLLGSCHAEDPASTTLATGKNIESFIPAERLAAVKAALPRVTFPALQQIFASQDTFWYDHEVMKPAYQDSTGFAGAGANEDWFRLIASSVEPAANQIYDRAAKRWRFPFATTAGMDQSTNAKVVNFLSLPENEGRLLPLAISTQVGSFVSTWNWTYPNGTVLGEVIFIKDPDGSLVPAEVRIRRRLDGGWAPNAFRPFPTAASLAAAVKQHRPNWQSDESLKKLVTHLEDKTTLTAKRLTATGLKGTFDQDGALDVLPEIEQGLVRELLTQTPFTSAYRAVWKENGTLKTYAASTKSDFSIVPNNYDAGVIEVSDDSCMRCHKETAKLLEDWFPVIGAYGEIWGKDGIFSFQPFDESLFPELNSTSTPDNRRMNPKLKTMGLIEAFDPAKHKAPFYSRERIGR